MRHRAWALTSLLCLSCGGSSTPPSPPPTQTASTQAQSEWPTYGHDQSRTSTNSAETLVSKASLSSLAPAWQALIGTNEWGSNSTPSVSGGTVYVGSSVISGHNFFAFDAQTGAPVWAQTLGASAAGCGAADVGIPATATIAGGVVVAGGADGAYYGLDPSSGAVLWRDALNLGPSSFAWASPLVNGETVYFGASSHCDNPSVRGELFAVSLQTGATLATAFVAPPGGRGGGIWNSPAITPDGQTLVIASGEDNGDHYSLEQAIVTLNPESLEVLQSAKEGPVGGDQDFGTSPIIFHDQTGRMMTGAALKTGLFFAFYVDNVSAGPAWTANFGVVLGATPAFDPGAGSSGVLYVVGTEGQAAYTGGNALLHALNPATGTDLFTPILVGNVANNVAIAGGLIFVNQGTEGLAVFDEATGALLRSIVPPNAGPALSGVAVAEGTVFWVSGAYLNAWRPPQ
jgi:outer membrane protein assembly factor BamB